MSKRLSNAYIAMGYTIGLLAVLFGRDYVSALIWTLGISCGMMLWFLRERGPQ